MISIVDNDEKGKYSSTNNEEKLTHILYASGQIREMWLLTEDGLYEVLMQSG